MIGRRTCALAAVLACATAYGQNAGGRRVILDQTGYWRQNCRFGPDRVCPALLASEGEKLLGSAGLARARKSAEDGLRRSGLDPTKVDWRQHVVVRFFFDQHPPYVGPPPPADWATRQFDDASWVFHRGFILQPETGRVIPRGLGWTQQDPDQAAFACLGIQSCSYRARFVVDDLAKAEDLTFSCLYRGGARVLVNGREVARGHLPAEGDPKPDTSGLATPAPPDAPAEVYPLEAYRDRPALRDRRIGPVAIPSRLLQKGTNVLAVEDDQAIRQMIRDTLQDCGYAVLVADGADGALAVAGEPGRKVDLLLTDVVMPSLDGLELSRQIVSANPTAGVLYMSGQAADVIAKRGPMPTDAPLLTKRFSARSLAEAVRDALRRTRKAEG